jgi:hypothetical protein
MLSGIKNSHIAALVERHSRFTILVEVRSKDRGSVVAALTRQVKESSTGPSGTTPLASGAPTNPADGSTSRCLRPEPYARRAPWCDPLSFA